MSERLPYEVEKLPKYNVQEVIYNAEKDPSGKHLRWVRKVISREVDDGYRVYFPKGHSLRFNSEAEMNEALRFLRNDDTPRDEDNAPLPKDMKAMSPKEVVQQVLASARTRS